MIDLNRIRSLKTLEQMKKDLTDFINMPEVRNVYLEDLGWGEEDLEADREMAAYLLEKVEARTKSLAKFLSQPKEKQAKLRCKKSATKEKPDASQSLEERDCDPCTSTCSDPCPPSP